MALTRITKGVIKPNENYDTHNINSTGIVTAVGANFTGNVSVGGTLTYEDVTSIDSVGIITAQNGIDCNGDLDVDGHTNLDNVSIAGVTTFSGGNGAATIGSNSDLRFVNGSNYGTEAPKLTLNNNSLYLQGGSSGIVIRTLAGNNRFWFNGDHFLPVVDSTSDLGTNSTRFRNVYADTFVGNANIGIITSTSIDLNGDIDVDGHTNLDNVSIAGVTTTTDEIKILTDNKSIVFGASSDLSMKHDGTNSYILNNTGSFIISADTLQFNNRANNQTKAKFVNNGAAELYHNGTRMFRTTAEGVIVSNIPNNHGLDLNGVGNNTCIRFMSTSSSPTHAYRITYHSVNNNIFNSPCLLFNKTSTNGNFDSHIAAISDTGFHLADNKKLHVGGTTNASSANGDLQIYHSSSDNNSYIKEVGSGALVINADDFYLQNVATTTFLRTHSSGAIDLNHSGNKKLETTSSGISVTGEVAASQDYPNFRPTLDLNFAAEKKLDPRITYSRTGPASFTDEFGKVVLVGDNAPRFDHDPDTRECKGLLIEETRTNLLKYSVDFASIPGYQENYSNARSTLSSTTEVAPDGTNTASKYVRTAGQGTGEVAIIIGNTLGLSSGTVYTSSIFVKNVGTNNILEFVNVRASSANSDSQFNLALGTITIEGSENTLTTITPYPNDWYRISVTATMNATGGYFWIRMYNQPEGDGFIIWGGQVEAGAFPTSYIPTYENASVTRGADIVLLDDIESEMGYNQLEGTVITDFSYTQDSDGAQTIFAFSGTESDPDNSSPRQWLRINQSAGTPNTIRYIQNGNNSDSSATATSGVFQKLAFAYEAGDQDVSLNGTLIIDAARTPDTNISRLALGNIGWNLGLETTSLEGHIKRFMYYPKKLPNSQLNTLTS